MDGRPIEPEAAAELLGDYEARQVGLDRVGRYNVSTVLLVIDHDLMGGPPVIFETMIFGPGPLDETQWRYTTRELAELGHALAVELAGRPAWRLRLRWALRLLRR